MPVRRDPRRYSSPHVHLLTVCPVNVRRGEIKKVFCQVGPATNHAANRENTNQMAS